MPQRNAEDWRPQFTELLSQGKREDALVLLESHSTDHAGTPKAADKRAACSIILKELSADPDELWRMTRALAIAVSPTRRELSCILLGPLYATHPREVEGLLPVLADDEHWEVRLWAGGLFSELFGQHFDELCSVYEGWVDHRSQFVRVAVATSVMNRQHREHPERAVALIELIEPMLSDQTHEVGRNLGPYAIGGALLSFFPEQTLEHVRRWARSEDEQVLWNVAMVFVAAEGRKHAEVALEILSDLARDDRRRVWRAVSSALRNLVKGDPDRVLPVLRTWLNDERKLPAALAMRGA